MIKFLRKYHKWVSIVFTVFILLFAFSGIILNHRALFSGIDINRNLLPKAYSYSNWNDASVKATLKISADSILLYGNVGAWLTDSTFSQFSDFNTGFPKGIENRKIAIIYQSHDHKRLAGTYFGLYRFDGKSWQKTTIPVNEKRITDIGSAGDTLLVLTRSHLLKTSDLEHFKIVTLPPPDNYDNKIGLFKTLWVIHSGEIYGFTGKILVDLIGLIMAFLTISGFIYFVNRLRIKKGKKVKHLKIRITAINKFLLKWHNKIGWITLIFLLITTATGMFLRPPLLIPIVNTSVEKIPYSELDTDNPWFDKLRRMSYDAEANRYIIATSEGFFYSDDHFQSSLKSFRIQPPVSIMGVTVFRKISLDTYLVGSFEGLYLWNIKTGMVFDYILQKNFSGKFDSGKPFGQYLVSGFSDDYKKSQVYFDYNSGAHCLKKGEFVPMPSSIQNQPISLWNTALEFHTGRIFQSLMNDFYILIVPLTGLALLFILFSGFIVWYKKYR